MPYYAPQDDEDDGGDFESKFNVVLDSKSGWANMTDINDIHGTVTITDNKSSGSANKK